MAYLQRERVELEQLVKARNAVKRKYDSEKFRRADFEKTVGETFKPIVEPLQKLVSETKEQDLKTAPAVDKDIDETPAVVSDDKNDEDSSSDELEDSLNGTIREAEEAAFETAASDDEEQAPTDKYMLIVDRNKSNLLDKVYGVRREGDSYMIGDSPIIFGDSIQVKDTLYPKTEGLLELLVKRHPDRKYINPEDTQNYRQIIEQTNAHKRRHRSDESIRAHNSKKFTDIIAPMFSKNKQGGSLPTYKVARRDMSMDYVYWDDPNELVDRLRLLIAEESAGNNGHSNEILSIIEELREAGYIY